MSLSDSWDIYDEDAEKRSVYDFRHELFAQMKQYFMEGQSMLAYDLERQLIFAGCDLEALEKGQSSDIPDVEESECLPFILRAA